MTKSHTELNSLKPIPPPAHSKAVRYPSAGEKKANFRVPPTPPPLQRPVFQTGSADN